MAIPSRHIRASSLGLRPALVVGTLLMAQACAPPPVVAPGPYTAWAKAPGEDCTKATRDPIVNVSMGGQTFDAVPTQDGCWIFASVQSGRQGIAVLRRTGGTITEARFIHLPSAPLGLALTHDEKTLLVASDDRVLVLDPARLMAGAASPIMGTIDGHGFVGGIEVAISADDHLAFVSLERSASLAVIDLAKARDSGYNAHAVVGRIPVSDGPVGLEVSPDGRYLYSVSEVAAPSLRWMETCLREAKAPQARAAPARGRGGGGGAAPTRHAQGVLQIIDIARASSHPETSILANVAAGCNPVRVALSPSGNAAYVTARGENALIVLDPRASLAARLSGADPNAQGLGKVTVGSSPVGIAVFDSGHKIVVANSDRFETSRNSEGLVVLDASKLASGDAAILGGLPAGDFPRQIHVTADGNTLILTNYTSGTVESIDLRRLSTSLRR